MLQTIGWRGKSELTDEILQSVIFSDLCIPVHSTDEFRLIHIESYRTKQEICYIKQKVPEFVEKSPKKPTYSYSLISAQNIHLINYH